MRRLGLDEDREALFEHEMGRVLNLSRSTIPHLDYFKLIDNRVRQALGLFQIPELHMVPIFHFLNVEEVNAYAKKVGEQGFIGVTPDLILQLKRYSDQFFQNYNSDLYFNPNMSDFMLLLMAIFLIGHELGHIVLGHCDSIDDKSWNEFAHAQAINEKTDSVVTEIGADRFGANFLFNYINTLDKSVGNTSTFIISFMAILSIYRVIGGGGRWFDEFFDSTHPPSEFRSLATAAQLIESCVANNYIDDATARQIAEFIIPKEVEVFEKLSGNTRSKEQGEQYFKMVEMQSQLMDFVIERHKQLYGGASI